MTRTHRIAVVLALAFLWGSGAAFADVRTDDAMIAPLIGQATDGSATFRRLLAAIEEAHGIVYITAGRSDRVRACLLHKMTTAGPYRYASSREPIRRLFPRSRAQEAP
jgi:type 1 glutamine amidotransferase